MTTPSGDDAATEARRGEAGPAAAPPGVPPSRGLACFDFDGTLTLCDTLLPFLVFAAGRRRFALGFAAALPALLAWKAGLRSNAAAKQRLLAAVLGGLPEAELRRLGERFATAVLPGLVDARAVRRLLAHRRAGHEVAIVSASPDLYIRPWAAALGVERVLASRLAFEDGRCTGALIGANCFGPEKVRRLELEFGALRHGAIHAYGDSPGDREMLARATHGHYRRFHARRAGAGRSFLRAMLRPPAGAA